VTPPRPAPRILARAPDLLCRHRPAPPRDPAQQAAVDAAWQNAPGADQRHDGLICLYHGHRLEHEVLQVSALTTRYRYFWAQRRGVSLEPPIRPLAVSGAFLLRQKGRDLLLAGQRSEQVEQYAGAWELIPSGGLGTASLLPDGNVDYAGQLLRELREEAGLEAVSLKAVRPLGLVEDLPDRVVSICCVLESAWSREEISRALAGSGEYQRMALLEPAEIRSLAQGEAGLVATSPAILDLLYSQ
jgi:8-oxo-dGTP pyrophosphatase MutT (NUDIX family)